jgi:antitoxin ParD1/3/4
MTTVTISLPDSLKAFVDSQMTDKGFGNVSEYFRSLLRDAQTKEDDARLEKLLLEGLASERIPLDEEFRARLAAKTEEIFAKYKDRVRL